MGGDENRADAFADHFSPIAETYARHRPMYPDALFDWLAGLAPARDLAWDCATGSGQAAVPLGERFEHVTATDASAAQLERASPHRRVLYRAEPAERTTIAARSVSLVTVAQALHWFDIDRFYAEVRRVTRPRALFAAWTYGMGRVEGARNSDAVNEQLACFYDDTVGPYWPPERKHIDLQYRTLPFPFDAVAVPSFEMVAEWSLDDLLGYLGTWSSVQRYRADRGADPRTSLRETVAPLWGDPLARHRFRWPLTVRAGRT